MDTGFKKLAFNGMELFLDKDCQADTIYAIRKDKIRKFELEPIGMGRHEGSDIFLRLVNQDVTRLTGAIMPTTEPVHACLTASL